MRESSVGGACRIHAEVSSLGPRAISPNTDDMRTLLGRRSRPFMRLVIPWKPYERFAYVHVVMNTDDLVVAVTHDPLQLVHMRAGGLCFPECACESRLNISSCCAWLKFANSLEAHCLIHSM